MTPLIHDRADRLPSTAFPRDLIRPDDLRLPLTGEVVACLTGEDGERSPERRAAQLATTAFRDGDATALQDLHQALFVIYETSFANPLSPACRHEHAPWLIRVRNTIESAWLEHDEASAPVPDAAAAAAMDPLAVQDWFVRAAAETTALDQRVVAYLEQEATVEDFKTFCLADAHLNYRFYDALVLALRHFLESVKTEISQHFWEEAGEGVVGHAHTRQFTRSLQRLGVEWDETVPWRDWRPFAGHNLYFCLGLSRRHFFKALGSLAMPELFDVTRDQALVNGLVRLGFTPETDFEYYWNHVEADAEHGPGWLTGVILPIVEAQPEAAAELMMGGALRMRAMRQFNGYLASCFGLE